MAVDLAGDITRHFDGTAVTADIKRLPKFGGGRILPGESVLDRINRIYRILTANHTNHAKRICRKRARGGTKTFDMNFTDLH